MDTERHLRMLMAKDFGRFMFRDASMLQRRCRSAPQRVEINPIPPGQLAYVFDAECASMLCETLARVPAELAIRPARLQARKQLAALDALAVG
jgi:hypothetical protein